MIQRLTLWRPPILRRIWSRCLFASNFKFPNRCIHTGQTLFCSFFAAVRSISIDHAPLFADQYRIFLTHFRVAPSSLTPPLPIRTCFFLPHEPLCRRLLVFRHWAERMPYLPLPSGSGLPFFFFVATYFFVCVWCVCYRTEFCSLTPRPPEQPPSPSLRLLRSSRRNRESHFHP